mgnify:FL=1
MDDVWYGRFWNEALEPLQPHARDALLVGAQPAELLPPLTDAPRMLTDGEEWDNGYGLHPDGSMVVSVHTDMPGVRADMWDWWFGWHGDDSRKYRLWHPRAHLYAAWADGPSSATQSYVGRTSFLEEYLGADRTALAIRFLPPSELGFDPERLQDGRATVIAARVGLSAVPLDAGYLVHAIRPVPGGVQMRSRFWIGGKYVAGRGRDHLDPAVRLFARVAMRRTENQARALLVHCAQEMNHLAGFLPQLHAQAQEH